MWTHTTPKGKSVVITSIRNANKNGFQIEGSDEWFSYTGQQKGLKTVPGVISRCDLISEQEAQNIESRLNDIRERKQLWHLIIRSDLSRLDLNTLREFANKIEQAKQQEQPIALQPKAEVIESTAKDLKKDFDIYKWMKSKRV